MVAFAIPPRACKKPGPDTTRHTPGLEGRKKRKYAEIQDIKHVLVFSKCIDNMGFIWRTKYRYCNQKSFNFINPVKKSTWTVVTCHPLMQCLSAVYTGSSCFASWLHSSVFLLPHLLHHLVFMWIWYAPRFQFSQLHFSNRCQWRKLIKREVHLTQCKLIYNY